MDLSTLHRQLMTAVTAEDVFGPLNGGREETFDRVRRGFRAMALAAHPDRWPGHVAMATEAFALLGLWRDRAEEGIAAGLYGASDRKTFEVSTRRAIYVVEEAGLAGDYYTLHACRRKDRDSTGALRMRVVRDPSANDLLEHEAQVLADLDAGGGRIRGYVPAVVDRVQLTDGRERRAAIFLQGRAVSHRLTQLREAYPEGLDPRDAGWIFNRMLEGLWFTHQAGLVHAAVLPCNMYVRPDDHGVELHEWAYAVKAGERPEAISGSFESWYPPEVLAKRPLTPATDLFMAARCLAYVLGGDPMNGGVPARVPGRLARFIRGCLLPMPGRHPMDAGALREEFDECLEHLYGKRSFRPLAVPAGING